MGQPGGGHRRSGEPGVRHKKLKAALSWFLEWGEKIEFLLDIAEDGEEPKALRNRPRMEPHLQFWWDAFWDLSGDRPAFIGGVGRIPFGAMDRWAERYGIDGRDEFDAFKAVMKAMDEVFVAHVAAKAERERKAKK